MDNTPDQSAKTRPLTFRRADATAADLDPRTLRALEASYRRGVHQAIAFCGDIADGSVTLQEARRTLTRAENLAGRLRFIRKDEGRGMLLDHIRARLSGGRARKP